jgi:hypothetical protein
MPHKIKDKSPKTGGEFFNFCKVIIDDGKCFICDADKHEDSSVYVLVANVICEESAMRILKMFSKVSSSDGCRYDQDNNQVRISACKEHYHSLADLVLTDGVINTKKIIQAKNTR